MDDTHNATSVDRGGAGGLERDPSQAWFWTKEWQDGERQADEDLAAGRTTVHDSLSDFDAYAREVVVDDGEHLPQSA